MVKRTSLKLQVSISVVAGARWAGLSSSQTADLLKFPPHHRQPSQKEKTSSQLQLCGGEKSGVRGHNGQTG